MTPHAHCVDRHIIRGGSRWNLRRKWTLESKHLCDILYSNMRQWPRASFREGSIPYHDRWQGGGSRWNLRRKWTLESKHLCDILYSNMRQRHSGKALYTSGVCYWVYLFHGVTATKHVQLEQHEIKMWQDSKVSIIDSNYNKRRTENCKRATASLNNNK